MTTISGQDGVLDEMHSGSFYVSKYRHRQLGVAKIFPREIPLGVAFRRGLLLNSTIDCLRKLFLLRENDILRLVEVYRKKADEVGATSGQFSLSETVDAILNMVWWTKVDQYGMFVACGIWYSADVSRVIPSSEQIFSAPIFIVLAHAEKQFFQN